jgi:hypothetical protein
MLNGKKIGFDNGFDFGSFARGLFTTTNLVPPAHPNCRCAVEYVELHDPVTIQQPYTEKVPVAEPEPQVLQNVVDRESANEYLNNNTRFTPKSTFKNVDEQLYVDNVKQIGRMAERYPVIADDMNVDFVAKKSKTTVAAVTNNTLDHMQNLTLEINPNYYNSMMEFIDDQKFQRELKFYMPFPDDFAPIYSITHEYGHIIQDSILRNSVDWQGLEAEIQTYKNDPNVYRQQWSRMRKKAMDKYVDSIRKDMYDEIIAIARQNNPQFKLKECLSEYGKSSYAEFFAESFANSQCGEPNELGVAMNRWLKEKGLAK